MTDTPHISQLRSTIKSTRLRSWFMISIRRLACCLLLLWVIGSYGQDTQRIDQIRNQLEILAIDHSELSEPVRLEVSLSNVSLSNLLLAVSRVHGLNLTVSPDVGQIMVVNNFSNVTVSDLLIFLCKEYSLDMDFTGNIFAVKKYVAPVVEPLEREIPMTFNSGSRTVSMDLRQDPLGKVFRRIIDVTGQNVLYSQGMEATPLTLYLKDAPIDHALEQLALTHGLSVEQTREGFYLFNRLSGETGATMRSRSLGISGNQYQIIDTLQQTLQVNLNNTPIATLIQSLALDLNLDIYTATPLTEAGSVTFRAKSIALDALLDHIFNERQNDTSAEPVQEVGGRNRNVNPQPTRSSSQAFTYKKKGNIYFFGTEDQLSVREVEVIAMMHRSVELLSDPKSIASGSYRTAGRTQNAGINYLGGTGGSGMTSTNTGRPQRNVSTSRDEFDNFQDGAEALVNILPEELKADLEIQVDFELNSFLVSGPAAKVKRFKNFLKEIDKPVPVVLIEVMILEVRKSATVETGISWGLATEPTQTQGGLFPEVNFSMGAETVNKIIGGFDGFGSFNIGQVVPEFYATIKAMEANGNLKIRSTPKLSTLNGHRAHLSIGETTYYVVTSQNYFGSQIPTTSEIRNFQPIDAELAVSIKPLVSGNGQVTLDINVVQSDFSGDRIEDDAPPGLTSREFSSIIRMQNQDLAILGGLEEKVKNDSGSGVPLLARIPIIKWLFSKREREDSKQKLTILIKPTVIL